jgi:hypothetical protein
MRSSNWSSGTHTRGAAQRCFSDRYDDGRSDLHNRRRRFGLGLHDRRNLFGLGLIDFRGLVNLFFGFRFIVAVHALGDFRLLVMNGRADRRQAGGMQRARVLDDIVAERIMRFVALDVDRLGRFEPHVVPAEVFEAVADLAEALRPHGRARGALACEKTGRK